MDAEGWLTSELASFGCAACGQPYGEAQIRLIAQREELYFVDLSCPHCGSQAVAIVTVQVDGEDAAVASGRLESAEPAGSADALPAGAAISVDDVIDMHTYLASYRGDLYELVAHHEGPPR